MIYILNHAKNKNALTFAVLIFIFLISLSYRIIFVYNVNFTGLHMGTGLGHDEYYYNKTAANLIEHGVFGYMTDAVPNAYITPGYPLFLAAVYSVFGIGESGILYAKLIQAFLSSFSVLLVFLIGKKISDTKVGIISAAFVSVYPPLVFYSRFLLTETLYIFLFLLYFYTQLSAFKKEGYFLHFASGVVFAAAILTRPLIFALMPLPYIYTFFRCKSGFRKTAFSFLIFLLGFILLMSPWWIRNIITMKKFILLCTQSNPFYYGIIENYAELPQSDNELIDGIRLILHYLKTKPVETVKWYTIGKINIIFGKQDYWIQQGHMYLSSVYMLHYLIFITGSIGVVMSLFVEKIRLISAYIVLNTMAQLLFIPVERYAVPLMPLFAICGAYILCHILRQCKNCGDDAAAYIV
jgi:4-amino-4-deoxy-L-arabinose transferase-like glycosyltransferase